jgi:trimethylamine--corrinoid protein Co-methyltransferase
MKRNLHAGKKLSGGLCLEPFTDDELDEIHLATIEVLEKTGVYIEDKEAREIFYDAGATVDEKKSVVKIPAHVVEDAIRTTPQKLILYGRDPKDDFLMESNRVGFTCFGEGVKIIDPYTGELRTSTKKDVAASALLADCMDQVDISERALGAHDVPEETAGIHNAEAILNNTTKHCAVNPQSGRLVRTMVDMGAAIMGGKDKLRERPILTMNTAAVAPLKLPQQCCEITIESAKAGLPVNVMSMAMAGASAPVHLAGSLVVRNAEFLAVVVLSQLTAKGAPLILGDSSGCMDMRTGIHSVGAPEAAVMAAAVAKLARLYGFPSWVAGG